MIKVITAPHRIHKDNEMFSVFLAGSIEMGRASDWQQEAIALFKKYTPEDAPADLTLFNPRRPDWDSTIKQEFTDPSFYQQVMWELNALSEASVILFYFEPGTISPISLFELGAFHHKAVVVCPEGYTRKGNVDINCDFFGVTQKNSLEEAVKFIIGKPDEEPFALSNWSITGRQ